MDFNFWIDSEYISGILFVSLAWILISNFDQEMLVLLYSCSCFRSTIIWGRLMEVIDDVGLMFLIMVSYFLGRLCISLMLLLAICAIYLVVLMIICLFLSLIFLIDFFKPFYVVWRLFLVVFWEAFILVAIGMGWIYHCFSLFLDLFMLKLVFSNFLTIYYFQYSLWVAQLYLIWQLSHTLAAPENNKILVTGH